MTGNGWFQIFLFFAVILLLTKPMGVYLYRVFERKTTLLDPVLRPIERLVYRACGIEEKKEMKLDGVRRGDAGVQRCVIAPALPDRAGATVAAVESAEAGKCGARSGVEHGGFVHDEYELAVLQR